MSRGRRFDYALQPVLLTRQWELDALLQDLNRINGRLQVVQAEIARLGQEMQSVSVAWQAESEQRGNLPMDRYGVVTRYLAQLSTHRAAQEVEQKAIQQEREAMVTRVSRAKRAVEASEQHRESERMKFEREQMRAEFKEADDQWVNAQTRMDGDE